MYMLKLFLFYKASSIVNDGHDLVMQAVAAPLTMFLEIVIGGSFDPVDLFTFAAASRLVSLSFNHAPHIVVYQIQIRIVWRPNVW